MLPQILSEPKRHAVRNTAPGSEMKPAMQPRVEVLRPPGAGRHPVREAHGLQLPTGKLELNADGLPLNRFIHLALGEVLKLSYDVAPEIAKRTDPVTLYVSKPVRAARLLGMVGEALRLFDVALVSGAKGTVRVIPLSKVRESIPDVVRDLARTALKFGRIIEIIPLSYATPNEAMVFSQSIFQMGKFGQAWIDNRLHAIVVVGDAREVERFREAVELVDRPALQGLHLRFIRPVYWQAEEMKKALIKVLEVQGVRVEGNGKRGGLRLIVIKPINALVVASPRKDWLNILLDWVARLDTPEATSGGGKHFIYFVRNARAMELGAVVMQVLSGKSGVVGKTTSLKPLRNATQVVGATLPKKPKARTKSSKSLPATAPGGLAVITDRARNALIFVGTADAYRNVLPILEQLDKPPRQVLIEATIAEVTLDKSTQFGIEAGFTNVDHSSKLNGVLSTIGGLGVGSAGLAYTLINAAGAVRLKLDALATEGRVRVLSSPRLLAMDNEPARIQIGNQIAILSQEVGNAIATTGSSTGLLRSFSYVDTGVILEVTPTINEGGVVQLKLHQEVSTAGASTNNTPPISKRSVDTTMVAKSGQSVLIGGLISHNKTISRTKVPILGDIPILGHLFSNDSITDRATELIVLITPHIISGLNDAEYLTRAFREQLGWASGNDTKDEKTRGDTVK